MSQTTGRTPRIRSRSAVIVLAALVAFAIPAATVAALWIADITPFGGESATTTGQSSPLTSQNTAILDQAVLETDAVLTIGQGRVGILRLSDSELVRDISVPGASIWASLRPSKSEVLVSSISDAGPILTVYDIADGLSIVDQIAMPDRVRSTLGYDPAMVVSADERFLYYLQRTSRCPQGGDAAVCDVYSFEVVDLTSRTVVANSELPANCGYARLSQLGSANVLLMCPNTATLVLAGPSGSSESVATFRFPVFSYPIHAGAMSDGTYFMVFSDGTIASSDPSEPSIDLLSPNDLQLSTAVVWTLPTGELLLGFGGNTIGDIRGVITVDPSNPTDNASFAVPEGTVHIAPLPGDRIGVLHEDGEMKIVSASTGSELESLRTPSGTRWLAID